MPPNRPNIHAPPPLSPVVSNHQSNRNVAPGMPPNMYPVNSTNVPRSKFCYSDCILSVLVYVLLSYHHFSGFQVTVVIRIPVMLIPEICRVVMLLC